MALGLRDSYDETNDGARAHVRFCFARRDGNRTIFRNGTVGAHGISDKACLVEYLQRASR
jgi:hypothetical protein